MWKEQIQKHRFAKEPDLSVGRHRVRALLKAFLCAHLNAVSLAARKVCGIIDHASCNQLAKNEF